MQEIIQRRDSDYIEIKYNVETRTLDILAANIQRDYMACIISRIFSGSQAFILPLGRIHRLGA